MSFHGLFVCHMWRLVLAGPDMKGKGKAEEEGGGPGVDADAQQLAPDSEEAQAQRAARDRVRSWQRLRLEGLTLLADVLESAEDALGRRRAREPDEAAAAEARLASIREDLQQASNCRTSDERLLAAAASGHIICRALGVALPSLQQISPCNYSDSRYQRLGCL